MSKNEESMPMGDQGKGVKDDVKDESQEGHSGHDDETEQPPQEFPDPKLLFDKATQYVWQSAKSSKKDFIKFVKYYNDHSTELNLDAKEFEALKQLREMWNQVNKATELPFYIEMKDQHTVLNGRLLCGIDIDGAKNDLWENYVHNFQRWRCNAMMNQFKAIRYMAQLQALAEGLVSNEGGASSSNTKGHDKKKQ